MLGERTDRATNMLIYQQSLDPVQRRLRVSAYYTFCRGRPGVARSSIIIQAGKQEDHKSEENLSYHSKFGDNFSYTVKPYVSKSKNVEGL